MTLKTLLRRDFEDQYEIFLFRFTKKLRNGQRTFHIKKSKFLGLSSYYKLNINETLDFESKNEISVHNLTDASMLSLSTDIKSYNLKVFLDKLVKEENMKIIYFTKSVSDEKSNSNIKEIIMFKIACTDEEIKEFKRQYSFKKEAIDILNETNIFNLEQLEEQLEI